MGDTASVLNEAYQLIENGQSAEARNLLKPLLETDSSNPDVWWLYVHAAEDAAEGRRALDRLAELSPTYPGLPDLYQQVTGTPLRPAAKPAAPPAPATLPDLPGSTKPVPANGEPFEEEFDDDIISDEKPGRRLPLRILALGAIILIVVIGLALLLSQPPAPAMTETPTDIAVVPTNTPEILSTQEVIATQEPVVTQEVIVTDVVAPTEEASQVATEEVVETESPGITDEAPVVTDEVVETDEPVATAVALSATEETIETEEPAATDEVITEAAPTATTALATSTSAPTEDVTPEVVATADSQAVLFEALAAFNVTEPDGISMISTRLGNTMVVNTCGIPGPAASRVLTGIMETLTAQVASIPSDVEALGVNIADCNSGAAGRTIAVPIGTVKAYSRNEIDLREFQRLWQPVG
jgi:hypothetical protein